MLFPKKVKHRKWQKHRRNLSKVGVASRGTTVAFGSWGLRATSYGRIRSTQIEAARRVLSRGVAKSGRVWIRIFPDRPYTAKPPEVGMGKGKGDPQGFEVEVLPGRILFEIDGLAREAALDTLRKAASKMPVKTRAVSA
ncbi:MAG: 50S ribosomal protein L16 [bacterium]|nr:50S ribosomal protein L16 [bacterium]MDZ4285219.1 50S ribosomal protein L16 [Patescibacteria group bacterium]